MNPIAHEHHCSAVPRIIGVTGHRDLRAEDSSSIEARVVVLGYRPQEKEDLKSLEKTVCG